MTDTAGYVADPPTPPPVVDPYEVPPLTEVEQQQLDELYTQLKPEAAASYLNFIMARTPARLQKDMATKVMDDINTPPQPVPPDPTVASVANGSSVAVTDLAGAAVPGSPGTAEVANSSLTAVHLTV